MEQSKDPIRLRTKPLKNGNQSLYLDTYADGRRQYEFLRLYLIPETNKGAKDKNKQTLQLANAIKAKRIIDLQNGTHGFTSPYRQDALFFDYYRSMCQDRLGATESLGNWGNWYSCLLHLQAYARPDTTFRDITPEFVKGFRTYLDHTALVRNNKGNQPLSQNTKQSYFAKFRACLNSAFEKRIIPINPALGIETFKSGDTNRAYLTIEELQRLAQTPCHYPALKQAFLFSCLTGLRKSDIIHLRWGDVQRQGEYLRLIFRQQKTQSQEYLDINPQAAALMGEQRKDDEKIFIGFRYSSYLLTELRAWAQEAGITKRITFHSARHTFAVLMLDVGVDIYTLSKLLGHKEISTTQIYAKILDKNKQQAIGRIPQIDITP